LLATQRRLWKNSLMWNSPTKSFQMSELMPSFQAYVSMSRKRYFATASAPKQ
jgi:hypothetical protein